MLLLMISSVFAFSFEDYFIELKENKANVFDAYAVYTLQNPDDSDILVLNTDKLSFSFNKLSNNINSYKVFLNVPYEHEVSVWHSNITCEDVYNETNMTTESICIDSGYEGTEIQADYEWIELLDGMEYSLDYLETVDVKIYAIYEKSAFEVPVKIDWLSRIKDNTFFFNLFDLTYTSENWAWWNVSFDYYKIISNLTGEFSYLNITYNANMNADFSDIRFVSLDNITIFNYTIEAKTDSDSALIRLNNRNNISVYMYYGNSGADLTENASDTYFKPRAYYYFDNNNVNDVIGTLSLTTNEHGTASATGYINDSRTFDGTNDNVSFSGLEEDLNGSNAMSMCLWFNADALTGDRTIISDTRLAGGQTNFAYRLHSATELQIAGDGGICAGGWWVDVDNGFTFSADTWYHLCLVLNTTGKYTFINGVFRNNTGCSSAGTYEAGNTPILLGDRQYSGTHADGYFDGEIDEVGFWKYSLTPNQVLALYNSTAPLYVLGSEITSSTPPEITLNSPVNTTTSSVTPSIYYTAHDNDTAYIDCYLYINDTLSGYKNTTNATSSYITSNQTLTAGTYYNYFINCSDGSFEVKSETAFFLVSSFATATSSDYDISLAYTKSVEVGDEALITALITVPSGFSEFDWVVSFGGYIYDSTQESSFVLRTNPAFSFDSSGLGGFGIFSGDGGLGGGMLTDIVFGDDVSSYYSMSFIDKDLLRGDEEVKHEDGIIIPIRDELPVIVGEPPANETMTANSQYTFHVSFDKEGEYVFYVSATGTSDDNTTITLSSEAGKIIAGQPSQFLYSEPVDSSDESWLEIFIVWAFVVLLIGGCILYVFQKH